WACLFGAPRQRFTLAALSWIATQVVHSQFVTCCPRTRFECHFDSKPGQLLRKISPASRKHALERGRRRLCPIHLARGGNRPRGRMSVVARNGYSRFSSALASR